MISAGSRLFWTLMSTQVLSKLLYNRKIHDLSKLCAPEGWGVAGWRGVNYRRERWSAFSQSHPVTVNRQSRSQNLSPWFCFFCTRICPLVPWQASQRTQQSGGQCDRKVLSFLLSHFIWRHFMWWFIDPVLSNTSVFIFSHKPYAVILRFNSTLPIQLFRILRQVLT